MDFATLIKCSKCHKELDIDKIEQREDDMFTLEISVPPCDCILKQPTIDTLIKRIKSAVTPSPLAQDELLQQINENGE